MADMTAPDPFAPATLGPVTLRNRIIKSATFEGPLRDNVVSDRLIRFHTRTAAGGVGMTTVAYCTVSPEGSTDGRTLLLRPEAADGLRRIADAVHAEGAAISAQVGHGADRALNGLAGLVEDAAEPCAEEEPEQGGPPLVGAAQHGERGGQQLASSAEGLVDTCAVARLGQGGDVGEAQCRQRAGHGRDQRLSLPARVAAQAVKDNGFGTVEMERGLDMHEQLNIA